ncbi:putative membrane protein YfhO [Kineothrix alysoides]|uniref:Putative membrane protein YfhO n=1 Tax=Kineothrix alysoides TaxID=1469948 RepID=A0A4R1R1Z4_9FIRM|nr:YfhO family protein [Kineothrix alysoides]TCL59361.1 putative membrane protein YfhO [Kineothrix alysoides]
MSIKKNKVVLLYGGMCLVIFSIIYLPILFSGKMYMFLDIGADTYSSYWPSIAYVADLLKDFKLWDMNLGLGASSMLQVSYFLIDPFNWVTFLFSPYNMDIGIFISLCLKYIALSIFAYLYFSKMGIQAGAKAMASLSVVFSGWFVGWGQHYNYATMFVFFIALLYFFECWLQEGRWPAFVITLAWLAMMMPYYCYMTLIFLALYYIVRTWIRIADKQYKEFIVHGFKTILLCFAGIGLSAIIFLPVVSDILDSPRLGNKIVPGLELATGKEYFTLLLRLLSNNILGINKDFYGYGNWYEAPFVYMGIIVLFIIPLIYSKKTFKRNILIVTILISFCMIFPHIPAIIFNAFSTITYRWTYVIIPVIGMGIGLGFSKIESNENERIKPIVFKILYAMISAILVLYCSYLLQNKQDPADVIIIYSILTVFFISTIYFLCLSKTWANKKNQVLIIIIIFALELTVNGVISTQCRSLIERNNKNSMNYFDQSSDMFDYISGRDQGIYRINKKYAYIDLNDSMIQHYNGEKYYSSILTDSYWNLQYMFDLRVKNSNYFYGFDDKQSLRDINCGKYMISTDDTEFYGFRQIHSVGNMYLYENLNNIGFGFLYDYYIPREKFDELNQYEKQNVVYEMGIIEEEDISGVKNILSEKDGIQITLSPVEFNLATNDTANGQEITLEKKNQNPLVVKIKNNTTDIISGNIYIEDANSDTYSVNNYIPVNFQAEEEKYTNIDSLNIKKMKIDLPSSDFIVEIYEKNAEELQQIIDEKKKETMKIVKWNDEYIEGSINASDSSLLYLPIIYDKDWKVYINGAEVEVLRINGGFSGVIISEGNNNVVIAYKPTSIQMGAIVTTITAIILVTLIFLERLHRGNAKGGKFNYFHREVIEL